MQPQADAGPALSITLNDEELALLRLTCDLFPNPESPLRYLEDERREPLDAEATYAALCEKRVLDECGVGGGSDLLARLLPVSECAARVSVTTREAGGQRRRDFYLADGAAVEYSRTADEHCMGPPQSEAELAGVLAATFCTQATATTRPLYLSAGDYLVFAVFARDVRAAPTPAASNDAMSIEEVLAYFDEPETKYVRTPNDDSWQRSVAALVEQKVLVAKDGGYELHPSLRPLARELTADHQVTVARFDFLDDHWLVRELNLYPTAESVFRLGSQPDGAVVIQELAAEQLLQKIAGLVSTLPNLLA